ncbi:MAG: choice-of-anchor D domain-containing protein [Acidobacteriaceae bacterium]
MNTMHGCRPARSSASHLRDLNWKSNQWTLPILALLALLWGMSAAVHAQTAAFSGSTSTIDATSFGGPMGITTDARGNIFVADNGTTANACNGNTGVPTVCELKRTGPGTYSDPVPLPGGFTCPDMSSEPLPCLRGMAVDASGNIWVADFNGGSNGLVYELKAVSGAYTNSPVAVTGPAPSGWEAPWGVAIDPAGNVFVSDYAAETVAEISNTSISSGTPVATTVVNAGLVSQARGIAVNSSDDLFAIDGNVDRVVELAPPYSSVDTVNNYGFQGPGDLALDASGNLWLSEFDTGLIREITAASNYATILSWGSGLNGPVSVWPDSDGTILVSDYFNYAIKQIATQGINLGTVAVGSTSGTQTLTFTFTGAANTTIQAPVVVTQGATGLDFADAGTGTCTTTHGAANPWVPQSICTVDVTVKPKYAGTRYGAVELLDTSGNLLATALVYGTGMGPQAVFPSNPSVTTLGGGFKSISDAAVDASGNVYVADSQNNAVDEIPPGCTASSCVKTLGGGFNAPYGVAVDGSGNVYVADRGNDAVKEMSPGCVGTGCVMTLGGGFTGPQFVAVDRSGNVYVTDSSSEGSGALKEIAPGCTSSSCVLTLNSGLSSPEGVAVDASGNVYVVDNGNAYVEIPLHCILSSCIMTLGPASGVLNMAVDGSGNVYPGDMAVDGSGNVYTATAGNTLQEMIRSTPPSLTFASTNVGSQSSDSPQAVTFRNIGNAPLTFPVPATGENPSVSANFTLDSSTTCPEVTTSSSTGTLAAGASCQLALDFLPTTSGQISGSAVVTDNNLNAPAAMQSVGLSGAATAGSAVTITPSVDFGTLYLGSIVEKTVTVTNSGSAAITLSDPLIAVVRGGDSSEFITLNLCPRSLAAGRSCYMAVFFLAGPFYTPQTATLTINDSVAGSPQSVPLTATVIDPVAQFSASSLSFGSVKTKSGSSAKSITVTSVGGTALSISNLAVTGADAGDFSASGTCSSANLNPKGACSITVTFKPSVKGSRTATLVVTDNSKSGSQSIMLSGTGD